MGLSYEQFMELAKKALPAMEENFAWQKSGHERPREFRAQEQVFEAARALLGDLLVEDGALFISSTEDDARVAYLARAGNQFFEEGAYFDALSIVDERIYVGRFVACSPNPRLITGAVGQLWDGGAWSFVRRS